MLPSYAMALLLLPGLHYAVINGVDICLKSFFIPFVNFNVIIILIFFCINKLGILIDFEAWLTGIFMVLVPSSMPCFLMNTYG